MSEKLNKWYGLRVSDRMEIGNFQGVRIFLEKVENSDLFLNCYFNKRELKLRINYSNVDILESNMEKAQSYYISNSIKDMYNELIANIQKGKTW